MYIQRQDALELTKQGKYWCFTLNNYTAEEHKSICETECSYIIAAKEVGDSGTPHIQGYVEFDKKKRGRSLKSLPGFRRAHIERRKAKTSAPAADYCRKEDEQPFEKGVISVSAQGKRTDLDLVVEALKEGATKAQLYKDHTKSMILHSRGILLAREALAEQRDHKTFDLDSFSFHPLILEDGYSHILVGESGCGKTSYAKSLYPRGLLVSHIDDLLRFDPNRHTAILFDDMSFVHMPRTSQIHLVDQDDDRSIHCRYACAHIPANTVKIFTTNVRDIFDLNDAAIKRRVKVHHIISEL